MKIFLLAVACELIALMEVPRLLKNKHYKDLTVFVILLLFSFTIALMQIMGVVLPNPTKGIGFLVEQVSKVRFQFKEF